MFAKIKGFVSGLGVGAIVAVGVTLWIVSAEGCRFRRQAQLEAKPVEAMPTERALKMEAVAYQCPDLGPVVILKPSEKQVEKIASDYQIAKDDLERKLRVLGEFDLVPMEWGGTALSYLDPEGHERLRVNPKAQPILEIPAQWSFYVEGSFTIHEQGGEVNTGNRYAGGVQYDALRFARFHLEPFAEAGWRGELGSYAEAGVRVSYKTR